MPSKKTTKKSAARAKTKAKPKTKATATAKAKPKTKAKIKRRTAKSLAPDPAAMPLSIESLRWRCDPKTLPFLTTDEIEPARGIVGQDAAVEALAYGLSTRAPGQNIFVRGENGTGRLTLIRDLLDQLRPSYDNAKDCCYVHNFAQPERPNLIKLAAGQGRLFRREMSKLADFIRKDLATALSSEGVVARRTAVEQAYEKKLQAIVEPFEEALGESGLSLVTYQADTAVHTAVFPEVDGKGMPPEEFDELLEQGKITEEYHATVRENLSKFEKQLQEINARVSRIRHEHHESLGDLLEHAARTTLRSVIQDVKERFSDKDVCSFLDEVLEDVAQNRVASLEGEQDFTSLYQVNLVLEHKQGGRRPVVIESAPTLRNLLGTIEPSVGPDGEPRAGHLGIKAGSLLRADGGYLVMEDRGILDDSAAWKVLMRSLRNGRVEITPPDGSTESWAQGLKPEPVDIDVKVIMTGSPDAYTVLDEHDADFPNLFKVLADFDSVIPRDEAGIRHYSSIVAGITKREKLPPFDASGVAALVEYGSRIAGTTGKLTARFGRLADIVREATFIAEKDGRHLIQAGDVLEAVRRGRRRSHLPSRKFRELVETGTVCLKTTGEAIGQINGLATMHSGPLTYGFPTRITATIGPGTGGIISIEQESELSGAIHTKGFYILEGLLRYLLRADHPLTFDASIAFEQSYGGIDGDSASGAEICCLLSALTGIPLRQDLAMTGAIDQHGRILAVGAVNEKIEGFFEVCRDTGFADKQGVIIPATNAGELMLRPDVVESCRLGQFRVYAVGTVQEAISLLCSRPTGEPNAKGKYPKNSVLGIAVAKAGEYWKKVSSKGR